VVGAMAYANVGVSRLEAALALFRDAMGLRLDASYEATRALLDAWGVAGGTTARIAELSCKGYAVGRLRLVEYTPTPRTCVRLDHGAGAPDGPADVGPKALDFYVRPPIAATVERLARLGYAARSAPVYHRIGRTVSEEVVVSGPDGLPLLFMIGHVHASTSLRPGSPDGDYSEIPTVSVIAGDVARSRHFYRDLLGLTAVNDAETPDEYRDLVDDLTGVPHGTRVHFLNFASAGEASGKVLVLHFFERTGRRLSGRMRPGHLGFSMLTHRTPDLDALAVRLRGAGYPPCQPPVLVESGNGPVRLMRVAGPNEEMFEFVEDSAP